MNNVSKLPVGWQHTTTNTLRVTELHTVSGWIAWLVNCILAELFHTRCMLSCIELVFPAILFLSRLRGFPGPRTFSARTKTVLGNLGWPAAPCGTQIFLSVMLTHWLRVSAWSSWNTYIQAPLLPRTTQLEESDGRDTACLFELTSSAPTTSGDLRSGVSLPFWVALQNGHCSVGAAHPGVGCFIRSFWKWYLCLVYK
jgi:hypothetical protein